MDPGELCEEIEAEQGIDLQPIKAADDAYLQIRQWLPVSSERCQV